MADEKSLNETRQLLMQAVERINELENSRTPTPPPRSSSGGETSAVGCPTYPYRPITREVQVHDTRNRRRISLSLNHSTSPRCGRADEQDLSRHSQPGPSQSSNRFLPGSSSSRRPFQLQSAKQERHSLFRSSTGFIQSSGGTARGKQPKAKKPKKMAIWKRSFVCLSQAGQDYVPGSVEKAELHNSGLGCKQLSLFEYGSSWEFHDELVEAFPKLANAGGYELMRTEEGNSRDLVVIPHPSEGYTASYLKSVVQHAKIYVRPLQQDLPLDTQSQATDDDEDDIFSVS